MPLEADGKLRIALGLPEWQPFHDVTSGQAADATYVIQNNLAKGLAARGHELIYAAPRNTNDLVVTDDPGDIVVAKRTWTKDRLFDVAGRAAWRIQQALDIPYLNYFSNYRYMDAALEPLRKVDLLYERNGLYNCGLAMAARQLGLPYVIFFEADQIMELDLMDRPVRGLLRRRAEDILRFNLKAADCIICVTEAGRQHLVRNWKVPEQKVIVFPNAVHVDRFKPDPEARTQVRASLGLDGQPVVIFVGNFFHWHDVGTLLEAFKRAREACPEARLLLVGDGERRAEMEKLAYHLGLRDVVRFTGIVPHARVPAYIAAADIAVVPYPPMQQEMWLSPLKLFEYMSSGKAVAASAVGQITAVLQDGVNGLLVPPGDAAALAEALVRLMQNPGLVQALGEQARADALAKYSWESYLSRLERVFRAVIAHAPVHSL